MYFKALDVFFIKKKEKKNNVQNQTSKIAESLLVCHMNLVVHLYSRCSVSSVKRSARSATVSTAASECFMVVLVWLQPYETSLVRKRCECFQTLCGSHLFSAVFSIACILSSIVDLIKNLWTNVGLVDKKQQETMKGFLITCHCGCKQKPPASYLVWPIRCTLPMAWSSWAGLRIGSTSRTCVASMMFRPLEPVWRGSRRMLILSSYLKELRFSWKCEKCTSWIYEL